MIKHVWLLTFVFFVACSNPDTQNNTIGTTNTSTGATNTTSTTNNSTGATNNSTGATNNSTGTTNNSTGTTNNSTGTTNNSTGTTNNSTGTTNNSTGTTNNSTGTTNNSTGPTPRLRSEIEADIKTIVSAYPDDVEFRVRKGNTIYHDGTGVYLDNAGHPIDRPSQWHSAGKIIVSGMFRALQMEGILNTDTLIRTADPLVASTPHSDLLTFGHCLDYSTGYKANPHRKWFPDYELEEGFEETREVPIEHPSLLPPGDINAFNYGSMVNWAFIYVGMHSATSVLPNGDIIAFDNAHRHPTWGEIKTWAVQKYLPMLTSLEWFWDGALSFIRYLKISEYEAYMIALRDKTIFTPDICDAYFSPIEETMTSANSSAQNWNGHEPWKWTRGGFWDMSQRDQATYTNGAVPPTLFCTMGVGGEFGLIDNTHNYTFVTSFIANTNIYMNDKRGGFTIWKRLKPLLEEWAALP